VHDSIEDIGDEQEDLEYHQVPTKVSPETNINTGVVKKSSFNFPILVGGLFAILYMFN
jgi:hypothetical protein